MGFYDRMNGIGAHEVIVETPHPQLVLEKQNLAGITRVFDACRARILDLSRDARLHYVLVFKNYGALAGATMPHPHTQLIAMPVTPIVLKEKLAAARAYYMEKDRSLFGDILQAERKVGDRVVFENDGLYFHANYRIFYHVFGLDHGLNTLVAGIVANIGFVGNEVVFALRNVVEYTVECFFVKGEPFRIIGVVEKSYRPLGG